MVGLLVQAGTTYVFLILAGRDLGPEAFGALSGLYILLTSVATGLFQPLEQEVARRRGDERVRGTWDDTLRRRALGQGLVAAGLAVVIVLLALPATLRILGEENQLVAALCVGLVGYACWFATRGELSGGGHLTRYGWQLGLDGSLRLGAAGVLVLLGASSLGWYAWLLALSPWLVLLVGCIHWRPISALPIRRTPSLTRPFYLLVVSALAAQLLINAGPLVVNLVAAPSARAQAGVFLAVLVVVRVPVFLFAAVQPSFLPALAGYAAADRRSAFVRLLGLVLLGVVGLGLASVMVAVTIGPALVEWLFDFDERLSRGAFILLTTSIVLFLVATVLAQALLSLGSHAEVTAGWLVGLAGLAVGVMLGSDAIEQATAGLLGGAVTAALALAAMLLRRLYRWTAARTERTVA